MRRTVKIRGVLQAGIGCHWIIFTFIYFFKNTLTSKHKTRTSAGHLKALMER